MNTMQERKRFFRQYVLRKPRLNLAGIWQQSHFSESREMDSKRQHQNFTMDTMFR